MAFDMSTAVPETELKGKFDMSTAKPETQATGKFDMSTAKPEKSKFDMSTAVPEEKFISQQEDAIVKEEADKFSLSGAAEQFATGAVNEALLGFPKYMIDKSSPDGQSIWKEMESENKAERIARGMGTFAGFMAGLPGKVFKAGSKLFLGSKPIQKGLNMLVSSKKARRLVQAAGAGASSFGLYEILKAPEEEYSEKLKTVPLNALIGGTLGLAGQAIKSSLVKKHYKNFAKSGDPDLIGVVEKERGTDLFNNNMITSNETRLARMGKPGSELEARIKDSMLNGGTREAAILKDFDFKNKIKLSKAELENVTSTIRGKTVSMNKRTDEVIKFFQKIKQTTVKEAKELGVETTRKFKVPGTGAMEGKMVDKVEKVPFMEIPNYFPQNPISPYASPKVINETVEAAYKRGDFKSLSASREAWESWGKFYKGKGDGKKYLQSMVDKKQAKNIEEARNIMDRFVKTNKTRRAGNLEYSREVDFPFWDPNPKRVIPQYIRSVGNRLEEIKLLGPNNEIANELISQIAETGGNQKAAREIFHLWNGTVDPHDAFGFIGPEMSKNLRDYQIVSKLGLATIANASQSTLTAIKYGVANTIKGIGQAFTKGGQDFGERSAAVLDSSLEQLMRESTGSSGIGGKFLKATGFSTIERFNRTVAANAGKNYIQQMQKKLLAKPFDPKIRRAFLEMRINPDTVLKNGTMTIKELYKAGDAAVKATQFKAGALDLPYFFNSPEGKIVTQFKSFAFNHAKFIKEAILEEAARGNYEPMIRAVALMPIIGEGVGDVRALMTGKSRDKKGLERIADNIGNVGGFGLFTDMWLAAKYKNLGGFFAGPTLGTLMEFGQGAVQMVEGNSKPLVKTALRQVPVVGPALKNAFQGN